ncbi:class I SAM-dependent methyltransferase [Mitsuaria sp. GD03876]|uniref:class I SAM-dependent methyltransferase n=1 Tax=Mitsuaria sp. GD03876 TaxID=2975399 RepID=UPI002449CFF9|nr:class I SAM-dependent methyltransferase [Mitsuaria sp. GD03876]MDH0864420.1 class I SAM-dependent methyltransferase [Mitsuaria sp. GD03876]
MSSAPSTVFSDADAVARYAEGPPRAVPGYHGILPMTRILLAERVGAQARVLVVGAGGGLELEAFAKAEPGWEFDGVDPSAAMLDLAARRLGPLGDRVRLHEGYVQSVPEGPFDAATCLLTYHFVSVAERRAMNAEIHRRLKPGAPFVAMHLSVDDREGGRDRWMSRYQAFLVASGTPPESAAMTRQKVERELTILTPDEDEALLREAGFSGVSQFFMGFSFRGWVAYA